LDVFCRLIRHLREKDLATEDGLSDHPPNHREGTLDLSDSLRCHYLALNEVYLLLLEEKAANPFVGLMSILRARAVLVSLCRGVEVTVAVVARRHADIYAALVNVLLGLDLGQIDFAQPKIQPSEIVEALNSRNRFLPFSLAATAYELATIPLSIPYLPSVDVPDAHASTIPLIQDIGRAGDFQSAMDRRVLDNFLAARQPPHVQFGSEFAEPGAGPQDKKRKEKEKREPEKGIRT